MAVLCLKQTLFIILITVGFNKPDRNLGMAPRIYGIREQKL